MLIPTIKNSIAILEGSLSNCPFLSHPSVAILRGGFFVFRGRLSECYKDEFTKHTTTLTDFATAETKFSLCERGHVAGNLPASGVTNLKTPHQAPTFLTAWHSVRQVTKEQIKKLV